MKKLMNVVLLAALVFTLNAGFFEGFPQVDDYGHAPPPFQVGFIYCD